ncbi:hypothetical protein Rwratislav_29539 [Rhodococcus wratislaviensis IFP 2016]|nr:hypothetical protein Rwratislav_29539 [Rhodococcus wratislaviensis IFP 2016]
MSEFVGARVGLGRPVSSGTSGASRSRIEELTTEITVRATVLAPSLLVIAGCGPLMATKLIGETAGVDRFRSKDAFARHNGTGPLPVWSSNHARHRLSRKGNLRINAAIRIIALTQAHCYPDARALLSRRRAKPVSSTINTRGRSGRSRSQTSLRAPRRRGARQAQVLQV